MLPIGESTLAQRSANDGGVQRLATQDGGDHGSCWHCARWREIRIAWEEGCARARLASGWYNKSNVKAGTI